MEVSYKRHFNKSYMILKGESEPEEALELNILAYNKIPGLLPVETEIADGEIRFWYDITGKQTLSDYLKHKQADFSLLQQLFQALEKVCNELSAYLLDEAYLILDGEYLYMDFEHTHMEFVYLPGRRKEIRESFQELMELLLQHLAHSDKQAVAVAYEMYQMSLQREKAFADMLKQAVCPYYPEEQTEPEVTEQVKNILPGEEQRTDQNSFQEMARKEWGRLKQRFNAKEKKGTEAVRRLRDSEGQPRLWNTEEVCLIREEDTMYHATEILHTDRAEQGILMYQGEGQQKDIRIDKPVFLIGKKEKEVDGYINTKSISRLHARIELVEGEYYIEDLNSTNGTYLNGERLEYRQKVKLKVRDRVLFGIEEYVFV